MMRLPMHHQSLGLKINIKKTEVMFQPNSTMTMEEDINVDENHTKPCERIHVSRQYTSKRRSH